MNFQIYPQGRKSTQKLYFRMYEGKFDICTSTDLAVFISDWDEEKELSKTDSALNETIINLKLQVLKQYNSSLSRGIVLNSAWLKEVIKNTFNRPSHEIGLVNDDYTIYFSDFALWWMETHAPKWKTSARKLMSKVLMSQYSKFVEDFKRYEATLPAKIMLKSLSQDDVYAYVDYLQDQNYSLSTISRSFLGRLSFFMNRAKAMKFDVSLNYNENIYLEKEEEIDGIFLDNDEIDKIWDKDFSFDNDLETTKDNFTIAVYSGMRSSDFLENLDISNFRKGYIEIVTQKTKTKIVVPIHKRVEEVLKKHHGMLPPKQTNSEFNKHIKTLCQICEIDEPMQGKVFDTSKNRKVFSTYPKYKMITAHSLRRSFCSNMRGKISDVSLCQIMGWSSGKLLSLYDKTSKLSHANSLLNVWSKE
jgi:site-specific recombinase XerD